MNRCDFECLHCRRDLRVKWKCNVICWEVGKEECWWAVKRYQKHRRDSSLFCSVCFNQAVWKTWSPAFTFKAHWPDLRTPHTTGTNSTWQSWILRGPWALTMRVFIAWTIYAHSPQWVLYEPMLIQRLQFATFLFPGWDFCKILTSLMCYRLPCCGPQL